ncbi:hypothetical protein [Natranaerobius thermophilus]
MYIKGDTYEKQKSCFTELGITDYEGYFVSEYEFIGQEEVVQYYGYSGDTWGEFIISVEN